MCPVCPHFVRRQVQWHGPDDRISQKVINVDFLPCFDDLGVFLQEQPSHVREEQAYDEGCLVAQLQSSIRNPGKELREGLVSLAASPPPPPLDTLVSHLVIRERESKTGQFLKTLRNLREKGAQENRAQNNYFRCSFCGLCQLPPQPLQGEEKVRMKR